MFRSIAIVILIFDVGSISTVVDNYRIMLQDEETVVVVLEV